MTGMLAVGKKNKAGRPIDPHGKKMVSLKLSQAGRDLIAELGIELGIDKTAVIELAVRRLREAESARKNPK